MTKIFNFALKIKGGGVVGRVAHAKSSDPATPQKIWNVHHHLGFKSINITKSPFIPEHENRFSPLVSMDTEAEDITEIGDTTFVEVQR